MLALSSPLLKKRLEEDRPQFLIFIFLGVAPRRYMQLFTMPLRKLPDGSTPEWHRTTALPRIANLKSMEHLERETESAQLLAPFRKNSVSAN